MRAAEGAAKPWGATALGNRMWDMLFYDATKVRPTEATRTFFPVEPIPEGSVLYVPPTKADADYTVCDLREYGSEQKLENVDTVVVAGLGSSALGAVALGRTVADALGKPVASIVAGDGRRDVAFEAATAMALMPINWTLHLFHPLLKRIFEKGAFPLLGSKVFDVVYAVPEAATLHRLLMRDPRQFNVVVGHSRGNLVISAALHALKFSLDQETDDKILANMTDFDVFTFGSWVELPDAFGSGAKAHKPRYHQFVGSTDMLGWSTSPPLALLELARQPNMQRETAEHDEDALIPFKGHNTASWMPNHMPVETLLPTHLAKKRSGPAPVRAAA
jgi:hypothetical protein